MALGLGSLKKDTKNKQTQKDSKKQGNTEAEEYLKKLEEKKANNPDECVFC